MFGRWVDCLNQDLLDFRWICGMAGVSRDGCGRTSVYERLHEFTSVCGFGRWAVCLNQDLLDFRWICGMAGVSRHGCGRMSVYESS